MHTGSSKRCTYCGQEHPAEAEVCSVDGHPLRPCTPQGEAWRDQATEAPTRWMGALVGSGFGLFLLLGFAATSRSFPWFLVLAVITLGSVAVWSLANLLARWVQPGFDRLMKKLDGFDGTNLPDLVTARRMRCPYCGERYLEGTTVCTYDAQPLERV